MSKCSTNREWEEIGEAVSVMSLQVLNVSRLYDMSLKLPTTDKLTADFPVFLFPNSKYCAIFFKVKFNNKPFL